MKINALKLNEGKITQNNEIYEVFNEFDSTIGHSLASSIVKPLTHDILEIPLNTNSLFFNPTSVEEIKAIVKKMKIKAGGVDNISVFTLKDIINYIAHPLQYIFNLAIEKCIWPSALKAAEVISIYKLGDKESPSNYRPILAKKKYSVDVIFSF